MGIVKTEGVKTQEGHNRGHWHLSWGSGEDGRTKIERWSLHSGLRL
jgi:hypothetical protein